MRCSRLANERQVRGALLLLPMGTIDHGAAKQYLIGKAHTRSRAHRVLACGRGGIHPLP
jgi:hypothetical protein